MAVKRNFTFPMSTLLYEGDLVLTAAEAQPAFAAKRLKENLVADSRTLLGQLGGKGGSAGAQTAITGGLTQQQDDAIAEMLDLFGKLKDSAKKAFKGQDVKLREEFQVGINSPSDLASILDRAKKTSDAARNAGNIGPLKDSGGWIADDTAELDAAIAAVGEIDKQQQASKIVGMAGTDARNTAANTLYTNLLTIQNAANIEWPEKEPSNRATRESFRIGSFPPSGGSSKGGTPPPPPAPPTPPTPPPP